LASIIKVPSGPIASRISAARREMDHALLRAEPPQLIFRGEASPEAAHVRGDALEREPDDEGCERTNGGNDDLSASTVGEREPVSGESLG
jgi:hypothetical protein